MKKKGKPKDIIDPDLLRDLEKIQRIYSITTSSDEMDKLLNEGIDSAFSISSLSKEAFVETYSDKLDSTQEAEAIWEWANRIKASNVKHVTMQLSYVARYDDDQLSKEELRELVELLCTDKRLLKSFRIHFAMKEGKG